MADNFLTPEEQQQLNQLGSGGGGFDDGFSFDTEGLDSEQVERGGWLDKEGNYHFEISEVNFDVSSQKQTPFVELVLVVLHSVPGQSPEGSKLTSRHYLTEGTRPMVTLLGHRIGALKAIDTGKTNEKGHPIFSYADAKTGNSKITKETWTGTKGNQFIGLVKLTPANDQFKEKFELVTNKCWPVDAEQVADVPKNLQAMKLIGKSNFAATSAGKTITATKAPPAKPPKSPPVAAPADDLSDL